MEGRHGLFSGKMDNMAGYLTLKLAEGGSLNFPPPALGFFSLKFLHLDQLPNAFVQLFLDNEYIF